MSATIIQLPTAAASPVINRRQRGQYPRGVVSLPRYRRQREHQAYLRAEHEKELAKARKAAADWAKYADDIYRRGVQA